MSSITFTCRYCNESGRHICNDAGIYPHEDIGCCDNAPCVEKASLEARTQAVVAAEEAVRAAQVLLANARTALGGAAGDEPHTRSIAELRAFGAAHNVDLGDATLKADVRNKLIEGLNVAGLRALAKQEGIELHGASTRVAIVDALNASEPKEEAPAWQRTEVTPVVTGTTSSTTAVGTTSWGGFNDVSDQSADPS